MSDKFRAAVGPTGSRGWDISSPAVETARVTARLYRAAMTFTTDDARDFVTAVRWQFAETMPRWPHEYTVRAWEKELEQDFIRFASLIRTAGTVKPWPPDAAVPRYHHSYLELDGWEYWTMGAPINETTVINRALLMPPRDRAGRAAASP